MYYDLIVLGVLGFSVVRGAVRGFVWQLASIAALVVCFLFAESLSVMLAPYISVGEPLNRWIAMFVLYIVFSFLAFATARQLRNWIERARFVEYDRHLGAVFGFLKGVTLCLVMTFFTVTLSEQDRAHVLESYSGYAAAIIMDHLHPVMPDELHEVLEPYIHRLDKPGLKLRHANGPNGSHHVIGPGSHDDARHSAEHPRTGEGPNNPNDELEGFLRNLEGVFDEKLRSLVRRALQNTSDDDRPVLMEKLSSGVPGLIRAVALQWKGGKPSDSQADPSQSSDLLQNIGAFYTDFPDAQAAIVEEIGLSLSGIPDRVAMAVLRDWHSDLMVVDPDPDPQTGLTTSLDVRILRQLSRARISLTTLSSDLQNRLRESLTR